MNKNIVTSNTTYEFTEEGNQIPEEHDFSVFATNPAGSGADTTIKETIPMCKICSYNY